MTRSRHKTIRAWAPAALALALAVTCTGCGSNDVELASVSGRVTLDGQPVQGVFVIFQPRGRKPSYAMLDADGRFALQYNVEYAGAVLGKQEVFLRVPGSDELGELPPDVKAPTKVPDKFTRVFETVEVKRGKNDFHLELTAAR